MLKQADSNGMEFSGIWCLGALVAENDPEMEFLNLHASNQ
jgi:hypothetical protein